MDIIRLDRDFSNYHKFGILECTLKSYFREDSTVEMVVTPGCFVTILDLLHDHYHSSDEAEVLSSATGSDNNYAISFDEI